MGKYGTYLEFNASQGAPKHCQTFDSFTQFNNIQGVSFNWYPPKKLKYVKPRLGESTLTQIGLDTANLAQINFFVLRTFRGGTSEKKIILSVCFVAKMKDSDFRIDQQITLHSFVFLSTSLLQYNAQCAVCTVCFPSNRTK